MNKRTKIVSTLGPATQDPGVLKKLIAAGTDVVRLNFSHGTREDHIHLAEQVRKCAAEINRPVGILVDLQGPKIRISRFIDGKIRLTEGQTFILDVDLADDVGTEQSVGVSYKKLPRDVKSGSRLLLDDGRITLHVEKISGNKIHTVVETGGILSNNKGINLMGGGLSAACITHKDREDIKTAAQIDADYLAVSFPRRADDIKEARILLQAAGGDASLIAKIERAEALDDIENIIDASEAVMIARGDLGVEIGDAELPAVQKRLIKLACDMNRVVITATQMMESMIKNPIPTRAEVFDVANAVLDGTDAVMLSAETAAGEYPVKAVEAMARICIEAEKNRLASVSTHRLNTRFERVDETIAMSTMYAANHLGVRAIASLTESGSTALAMSRISSSIPIYALTRHNKTIGKAALYRDVYPVKVEGLISDHAEANRMAIELLKAHGAVKDGDLVIITKGDLMGVHGGTNAMKIVRVGYLLDANNE